MATVILRTTAGAAHDHAVRNGNTAVSPIAHIKLLSGTAVTSVPDILALTSTPGAVAYSFDRRTAEDCDWAVTESTPTSTRIEAHLIESITGMTITGVEITLENGVLWGYAPYLPQQGGLTKTTAFSWTLDLLIVESTEDATMLQLTYSPLDYRAIRDRLLSEFSNLKTKIHTDLLAQIGSELLNDMRVCGVDGNAECDPVIGSLISVTNSNSVDGGTL